MSSANHIADVDIFEDKSSMDDGFVMPTQKYHTGDLQW
jgi:hypothetical protein